MQELPDREAVGAASGDGAFACDAFEEVDHEVLTMCILM
jgi:hypothetical protein